MGPKGELEVVEVGGVEVVPTAEVEAGAPVLCEASVGAETPAAAPEVVEVPNAPTPGILLRFKEFAAARLALSREKSLHYAKTQRELRARQDVLLAHGLGRVTF